MWIVRHAFAIAVLLFTMAVFIPMRICRRYHIAPGLPETPVEWVSAAAAVLLFLIGITLFVTTVALFAKRGKGTLAPWDPPATLVVRGPYRFVRNPMISGVVLILLAESLFLRSMPHLMWTVMFLSFNLIYIPALEEPQLEERFGEAYRVYKRNVPRFLPRLSPWDDAAG